MHKFCVVEWYVDALCPSGANDHVVNSEVLVAESVSTAEFRYRLRHEVDVNNELRTHSVG